MPVAVNEIASMFASVKYAPIQAVCEPSHVDTKCLALSCVHWCNHATSCPRSFLRSLRPQRGRKICPFPQCIPQNLAISDPKF